VEDLIAALIKKAQIEDEVKAGPIRVYEAHSHKIHKELTREHPVAGITDFIQLIAERIPEEDLKATQPEFINAFHFQGEPSKPHGIPFKFHIKEASIFQSVFLYVC
jgi:ubiquitin carboxyl-terminal hydrolase 7